MKTKKQKITLLKVVSLSLLWGSLFGCSPNEVYDIVATTTFLGDLATQLAGEDLTVYTLMKPGVDPHLFRATAQDVERLLHAKLILYHGLNLEAKLAEVLHRLGDKTFAVASVIPPEQLIKVDEHGTADPHIWWDPQLWLLAAQAVYEQYALILSPSQTEALTVRWERIKSDIAQTHREADEMFSKLPKERRALVTAHDAFQYFGRAYGLSLRSIQGISTVAEANPRILDELAEWMIANRVEAAFFESTISPKTIRALEEAIKNRGGRFKLGGELFSDSTGFEEETRTWKGAFLYNIQRIYDALKEDFQ